MNNTSVREALLLALERAKQAKMNPGELTDDKKLREDLGLDSLAMIEMVWEIEEKFQISIDEASLKALLTVGDVVHLVSSLVENKSSAHAKA